MPPVQTTYNENMRPAVAGMQADMTPSVITTFFAEAAINFGMPIAQGVAERGGKLPTTTQVTRGVAMYDRSIRGGINPNGYETGESMRVMRKGRIWVVTSVAVTADDPVFVIPTTGAWAKTNASSAIQIPDARWVSTIASAGLAILEML